MITELALILAITAPTPAIEINDRTTVVMQPLLQMYTDEELAGAGQVTVAWAETVTVAAAFVPYDPSRYPECGDAPRCIIFSPEWWPEAGGYVRGGVQPALDDHRRAMVAHEFAHVLSLERKETDRAYAKAVNRVDEECLADAVAAYVLARNDWAPAAVHYQCDEFWLSVYGEDRTAEALALAEDLLNWATHRFDPPPEPEPEPEQPLNGAGTATMGAQRGLQQPA